jgi:type IV pilus assembly protein PilX
MRRELLTPIQRRSPRRQTGTALIVALVALVAMIAAGFALFRSVDTANLAAGNYQFVRSAQQNVDLALNEALLAYMQSHPNSALNVMNRNITNTAINYYATQQAQNGDGVPTVLANLSVPAWTTAGPSATGWPGEQIDNNSRQLRRYVIERMCSTTGPGSIASCRMYEFDYTENCKRVKGGGCSSESSEVLPFIRITVRIDGPKNAVAYSQMFMKAE